MRRARPRALPAVAAQPLGALLAAVAGVTPTPCTCWCPTVDHQGGICRGHTCTPDCQRAATLGAHSADGDCGCTWTDYRIRQHNPSRRPARRHTTHPMRSAST